MRNLHSLVVRSVIVQMLTLVLWLPAIIVSRLGPRSAAAQSSTPRYVRADAAPGGDGLSWETAYHLIQNPILEAERFQNVSEIHVATGTYYVTPPDYFNHDASLPIPIGIPMIGGYPASPDASSVPDPVANPTIISGGIRESLDQPPKIVGSVFTVITAFGNVHMDGFIIEMGRGLVSVIDLIFEWNFTQRYGGGGMTLIDSSGTFRNMVFRNNDSSFGGGITIQGGSPTFENCVFEHNRAIFGGAILMCDSSASFIDCKIQSNDASRSAGGVFAFKGNPVFENCEFAKNRATNDMPLEFAAVPEVCYGGALFSLLSAVSVTNSTFIDNSSRVQGGAVVSWLNEQHAPGAATTFNSVRFANNSAFHGAVMYAIGGSTHLNDVDLESNVATFGSGIINQEAALHLSVFSAHHNFTTWYGGPLANLFGEIHGNRLVISRNRAVSGAGIYNRSGSLSLTNTLITKNLAWTGAGLVDDLTYYSGAEAELINTTIAHNFAIHSGGGMTLMDGSLAALNSIVWDNKTSGTLPNVRATGETELRFDHSSVEGGCPTGFPGSVSVDCGVVYDDDPLFVDPEASDYTVIGNFRLQQSSPAIDAGLDEYFPVELPDIDLDGNDRFIDHPRNDDPTNVIDLGPYETATPTPAQLIVAPVTQTRLLGETASVTASVADSDSNVIPNQEINFVVSGINTGHAVPGSASLSSGADGEAVFSYEGVLPGQDVVNVSADPALSGAATVVWQAPPGGGFRSASATGGLNPRFSASVAVRGSSISGAVQYTSSTHNLSARSIQTAWGDRNHVVILGQATVGGSQVQFRVDISGTSRTFRIRWPGFDSGELSGGRISIS